MINEKLITYLHSVYPELPIDTNFIKGYSDDELAKIERLYDIKIRGQLYHFLSCMGRCSGGFIVLVLVMVVFSVECALAIVYSR